MAHQVLARKWRPRNFADVVGQDHVVRALANALDTGRIHHAYLFTGTRGVGKTTLARILAKALNCLGVDGTGGITSTPCGVCKSCTDIDAGRFVDLLEVDAATNTKVDEMRELLETAQYAPVSGRYKVYIIDEVHMLSKSAFNSMLKTLEEPPSHAVFMLCTTEMQKIPATILSRCFHISFRLATQTELVRSFKRVMEGEGIEVDEKILLKIAELSDGGFRDGTKILEEIVALSGGKKLDESFLEGKFHVESIDQSKKHLLSSLFQKDTKASLAVISDLVSQGVDTKYFLSSLMLTLHEDLLSKVGIEGKEKKSELILSDIQRLLQLLSEAAFQMKSSPIVSLPLELAVIEWCEGEIVEQGSVPRKSEENEEKKENGISLNDLRKTMGNIAKEKAVSGEKEEKIVKEKRDPADVSALKFNADGEPTPEWVQTLWKNIIIEMKNHNHMIAGVLRSCRIVSYDRKTLVIEALSKFHKEKLDEAKTFPVLEKVCEELIGNKITVSIQLKQS